MRIIGPNLLGLNLEIHVEMHVFDGMLKRSIDNVIPKVRIGQRSILIQKCYHHLV